MAQVAFTPTTASAQALRLANALADSPSPRLLLLCGPPGVGKSALLRATVLRFRKRRPAAAIFETHGEALVESLIEAIHRDALNEFRRRVTRADLIAIDDLHTLRGKARTQEEVAGMLRAAVDRGARIVCAAGSPKEVPVVAAAVRRTAHARMVRIPRATARDARRILSARARADGLALTDASLTELAARSRADLRVGIGALARIRFERWVGGTRAS
jgi:chromosomal replication initiator protein